jgi:hypothetical protein
MLPRWHIFWGAIFALIIWIFAPGISYFYLALVFFASFLIDFDHYVNAVHKTRKVSLFHAFDYHKKLSAKEDSEKKKGIRKKGDFHLFHTIEFHVLVAALGFLWTPFFFIFLGMVFHSLLDLMSLLYYDKFYVREYFFFSWTRKFFR